MENKNEYDKIEVIAHDFGSESKDFCTVLFYKNNKKEDEAFFPVSLKTSQMAQLLKMLHENYGIMPNYRSEKVKEDK